ncbi:MAG: hypothetical protein Q9170_005467 [Blastenia crenularia]
MAFRVSVESLPQGSAHDRLAEDEMSVMGNHAVTAIGMTVKHDKEGTFWHKFKSVEYWGMEFTQVLWRYLIWPSEHAVYHSLIRRHLIDFQKTKGKFDFKPASGRQDDADVTSFHIDQKAWGPLRENFPPILFTYVGPEKAQRKYQTTYMYFNRMLVIDKDHRPVKAFPELNLTISSKVEGFRLEAIARLNPKITSRDILARMPSETRVIRGLKQIVHPQCKSNALSMRRRDFRGKNCLLSWTPREGSKEVKRYLDSLLGPRLVALNNTRDMRPLKQKEIDHVLLLIGKGKHPERSRYKKPGLSVAQGRLVSRQYVKEEPRYHEAADSDTPTDLEDHFEPMNLDEIEDAPSESPAVTPDSEDDSKEDSERDDLNDADDESSLSSYTSGEGTDLDDESDLRNYLPTGPHEVHAISEAMEPTIQDYNFLLDADLRIATPRFQLESYNTQWYAVQEAFEKESLKRGRDPGKRKRLYRFQRWEDSIWGWRTTPVVDSNNAEDGFA